MSVQCEPWHRVAVGPLVAADRCLSAGQCPRTPEVWKEPIERQLEEMDQIDGQNMFSSNRVGRCGRGSGKVESMDVHGPTPTIDLLENDEIGR